MTKYKNLTIKRRVLNVNDIVKIPIENIEIQRFMEGSNGDHYLSIELFEPSKQLEASILEAEKKGYLTYDEKIQTLWLKNRYDWNLTYSWIEV